MKIGDKIIVNDGSSLSGINGEKKFLSEISRPVTITKTNLFIHYNAFVSEDSTGKYYMSFIQDLEIIDANKNKYRVNSAYVKLTTETLEQLYSLNQKIDAVKDNMLKHANRCASVSENDFNNLESQEGINDITRFYINELTRLVRIFKLCSKNMFQIIETPNTNK